jgi:hypothetical protein
MPKVVVLALVIVLIAGTAFYCVYRSECSAFDRGLKGEIRRTVSGSTQYFDGRCWATAPMPPTDSPF